MIHGAELSDNRLLILDDDPRFLNLARRAGARCGFQVLAVSTIDDFKAVLASFRPSLMLLDVLLAHSADFENVLDLLSLQRFRGQVILVSGLDFRALESAARSVRCHGLGIIGIVEKGRNLEKLNTLLDLGRLGPRGGVIVGADAQTSIDEGVV